MQYDPIKNVMAFWVELIPPLRKAFYFMLDAVLLRQWYIKKWIKHYYQPDDELSFYDAGAGFCQYSDYVLSGWKHSEVFALDLKTDYLESYAHYAGAMYKDRFVWKGGDLVLYKPDKCFHLIAAIDILEHIENDRQVLKNFYNCLLPGGRLLISTPSDLDEAARFTAEHVRPGYNPSELKEKLIEAGFTIQQFEYSYGRFGKAAWILGMKKPLQMVGVSKVLLLILPLYYMVLYPVIFLLMKLDLQSKNESGNGLVVVAVKPV